MDANAALVAPVKAVAARHDATPAQVALAWLLAQGEHVVPIPGTKRRTRLEENAGAAALTLERRGPGGARRAARRRSAPGTSCSLASTAARTVLRFALRRS